MKAIISDRSKKLGREPGALVHVGKVYHQNSHLSYVEYVNEQYSEIVIDDLSKLKGLSNKDFVWLKVNGVSDTKSLNAVAKEFRIPNMSLSAIMNTEHRPKINNLGGATFVILKAIVFQANKDHLASEQIALFFGKNFVITFAENDLKLEMLMERILSKTHEFVEPKIDYLVFSIIDIIIDQYFIAINEIGEKIVELEEMLIEKPSQDLLSKIYCFKRELIILNNSVWPIREVLDHLCHTLTGQLSADNGIYIHDTYDHTLQIIELLDGYQEILSGMLEVYLSSISNRMNEIMKVLTMFSTIFIPLTFIAGVYGMNFKNMPEINSPLGYPVVISIFLTIIIGMLVFFKRKKWF